jgi:hypothetical protein
LHKRLLSRSGRTARNAALAVAVLALTGCVSPVRHTTVVPPSEAPAPALEATLSDLLARLNEQTDTIKTLTATVDFEPTTGSVYSGVIKEYHDVKGFILLRKPSMIRILGQAPVVRTDIFDMVSDGHEFKVSIPPKHKFIVGPTDLKRPAKNALENLRPQHILEALAIPPIDRTNQPVSFEEDEGNGHRYYVVTVLEAAGTGEFFPLRRIWFDRADLNVARVQIYGPKGHSVEDVRYSGYRDFGGVTYPTDIQLRRPVEDYALAITVQKAVFNQPIPPEKFELKKPPNAELVDLSEAAQPEDQHGK